MGIEKQGAKPTGFVGKIFGKLMNKFHTRIYINYFEKNLPAANAKILDVGCGGGKFLNYLSVKNKDYLLFGLDHSSKMISLSQKVNQQAISQNRLKLIQGSASKIPLDDLQIDLATAFETIQFWPDIATSFASIERVLKKGGKFVIINRYPAEGSKWWRLAKLKTTADYKQHLENAGFKKNAIDLNFKKGWIVVEAIKE